MIIKLILTVFLNNTLISTFFTNRYTIPNLRSPFSISFSNPVEKNGSVSNDQRVTITLVKPIRKDKKTSEIAF